MSEERAIIVQYGRPHAVPVVFPRREEGAPELEGADYMLLRALGIEPAAVARREVTFAVRIGRSTAALSLPASLSRNEAARGLNALWDRIDNEILASPVNSAEERAWTKLHAVLEDAYNAAAFDPGDLWESGRLAAEKSRDGSIPDEVRECYRSVAWTCFRAARGLR